MNSEEKLQKLLKGIEEYTKRATVSPEVARATLIREGIYTEDGELAEEFGGPPRKKEPKPA
jgi:hypothetical protein